MIKTNIALNIMNCYFKNLKSLQYLVKERMNTTKSNRNINATYLYPPPLGLNSLATDNRNEINIASN